MPARARRLAIVFAAPLAVATYVDRVRIPPAAPPMSRDPGPARSGAPFEVPGGWLGD
jgi:hypothetical protein